MWESFGFYKTLIRMYPWDIMVIGTGNSFPTHTLEYLVSQFGDVSIAPSYKISASSAIRRKESGNKTDEPLPWQF